MSYIVYRKEKDGYTSFVDNRQKMIDKIRLGYVRLPAGSHYRILSNPYYERVVVLLEGAFVVSFNNGKRVEKIGPRTDIFTEKAWGVYIPVGEGVNISTESGCEAVLCWSKAEQRYPVRVITPHDVTEKTVGSATFKRTVFDIAGADFPAHRIMLGETVNPAGKWSSFPPHKHDTDRDSAEVELEEVYYFRIQPKSGFGFQRIYSPDKQVDTAVVVKHHSAVMIPYGYHPVSASPGYDVYYLWVLAGQQRRLCPSEDPEHSWITKH